MSGIFLSYRRDDASGWAGRLYEHLVREWGPDQVFMDIDTIAPGDDFRQAIARTMDTCDVVLVMIGPNWLSARDAAGARRLDDEADTHRSEIVAALRSDVRVVPVLVGGADMPKVADLPEPLRDLVYRNAAVIEDRRFASDVASLQEALRKAVAERQPWAPVDGRGAGDSTAASSQSRAPLSESRTVAGPGEADGRPMNVADGPQTQPSASAGRGADQPVEEAGRGPLPMGPVSLAVAGALMVLVWGIAVRRGWHNEVSGVRVLAGALLVAGVAAGLWLRRWRLVLGGGIAGLTGTVLWLVWLTSTHGPAAGELFSFAHDGLENALNVLGAVLVLIAGAVQVRRGPGGTSPPARP